MRERHRCRVSGNTVWSHIARDFPYSTVVISNTNCYIRFHFLQLNRIVSDRVGVGLLSIELSVRLLFCYIVLGPMNTSPAKFRQRKPCNFIPLKVSPASTDLASKCCVSCTLLMTNVDRKTRCWILESCRTTSNTRSSAVTLDGDERGKLIVMLNWGGQEMSVSYWPNSSPAVRSFTVTDT